MGRSNRDANGRATRIMDIRQRLEQCLLDADALDAKILAIKIDEAIYAARTLEAKQRSGMTFD